MIQYCFVYFSDVMKTLLKSPEYGKKICKLFINSLSKPRNGKYCNGQIPITPTKLALRSELNGDSWKLYDFIVRRFIAAFSNDCKYYSHTVNFKIGTEHFMYNWKTLIDAGFTAIIPREALPTNQLVVNFEYDDKLCIQNVRQS